MKRRSFVRRMAVDADYREVWRIMLEEHDFVLKSGKAEYNAIRISTHIFNTEEDVDRMVEALGRVLVAQRGEPGD